MILVSPGQDLDIYLDVTRNGEPVASETTPEVTALWFNGANLLTSPVSMTTLGTGLYFATIGIDSGTDLGAYKAEMQFTRLGKTRREVQDVQVVPDQNAQSFIMDALLPGNTAMSFIVAAADVLGQNAAQGRLERIDYRHKLSSQPDFSAPVLTGSRKFYYSAMGDLNPVSVG